MQEKIDQFKRHVQQAAANPDFIHHEWFVPYHLEIVEKIAFELLEHYPEADRDLVTVMVWLHDYGKILDFANQYSTTLSEGRKKLLELGFDSEFTQKAVNNIEVLDRKMEVDLHTAPIEVQIVSSADGCSHMFGPFLQCWWKENASKSVEQLMADNLAKLQKDWNRKIVLPQARTAMRARYNLLVEQSRPLPDRVLSIE